MYRFNRFIITAFCFLLSFSASLYAGVSKGETTIYKTYSFESEGNSFTLYIATSNGKFLYAGLIGEKEMASCTLNNQKFYDAHSNAPKKGKIVCGGFESHFAKDSLLKPTYNKKPIALQQTGSFTTQELKIEGKIQNGSYRLLLPIGCDDNEKVNKVNEIINNTYPTNVCNEANYDAITKDIEEDTTNPICKESANGVSAWEIVHATRISYFDSNIFVLEKMAYEYCGGAHGLTDKFYSAFDRKSGEKIALRLHTEQEDELKNLLWNKLQAFAAENKAELLISKDEFKVSSYIAPSYDGLDYIYPPYSVLPYSYGFVTLTLSRDEAVSVFGEEIAEYFWK